MTAPFLFVACVADFLSASPTGELDASRIGWSMAAMGHFRSGDQGLASGVERYPKSSTDIDSKLGLSAQSRGTFGPIAGVGYGSLTDVQKQESLFKVSNTYENEPQGPA